MELGIFGPIIEDYVYQLEGSEVAILVRLKAIDLKTFAHMSSHSTGVY
jgi:hypothetical protein